MTPDEALAREIVRELIYTFDRDYCDKFNADVIAAALARVRGEAIDYAVLLFTKTAEETRKLGAKGLKVEALDELADHLRALSAPPATRREEG